MIQSMTGYGKSEKQGAHSSLAVEIRAVNNRFFDLSLRLPETLEPLEEQLKRTLSTQLLRGRVKMTVTVNGNPADPAAGPTLNWEGLENFHESLRQMAGQMEIREEIRLEHLLSYPELWTVETTETDLKALTELLQSAVAEALQELIRMRRAEGESLHQDILSHLERIRSDLEKIERGAAELKKNYFAKTRQRLNMICEDMELDENRILQEAAILAKKADITEECERLKSHVKQFCNFLESDAPVGKKMTFLLQEMNREITTIGAKAENVDISHIVVNIKDELEKIREQAQNIL